MKTPVLSSLVLCLGACLLLASPAAQAAAARRPQYRVADWEVLLVEVATAASTHVVGA